MFLREGVLRPDILINSVKDIIASYRKDRNFPNLFLKLNLYSEARCYNQDGHYFNMAKMYNGLENLQDT